MKICFLNDNVFGMGGAQRCTTFLANSLRDMNYDVEIISTNNSYKENYNLYGLRKDIKIKYFKLNSVFKKMLIFWTKIVDKININTSLFKNNFKILKYIYYGKNKKLIRELERYINEKKFDCIIGVSSYHSVLLSLLNLNYNVKRIGWQHSTTERYFTMKGQFLWNQDALVRYMFNKLDHYVVLTDLDKKQLKEIYDVDVIRIYNPCGFKIYKKSKLDSKTFLAVGRLEKVKGFDKLIEAFYYFSKKNNEWNLKIYGSGSENNNLKNLINEYNLMDRVTIEPFSSNIRDVYAESNIFLFTSIKEGFGLVLLEAMEAGLPIIAFDLPCVHEVLDANNSIIVEYLNTIDLSNAMLDLIKNNEKMKIMAQNGINHVKKFEGKKIVEEWIKLLK